MRKFFLIALVVCSALSVNAQNVNKNQLPPPPPAPDVEEMVIIDDEVETEPMESSIFDEEDGISILVEKMPEFPGGQRALFKYIAENLHYPAIAQKNGIQGKVVCQFIVNTDGSISDVVVVRSAGDPSLDKEAIRLIKSMPKWNPGMLGDKLVRVKYSVPVNFRLE